MDRQSGRGELSLCAPRIIDSPEEDYASWTRRWQGIPGVERAENGRLWACWYSGGAGEGPDNYVVLVTSGDEGRTWSEPVRVVEPAPGVRAFDPCLWIDPLDRLWLFWSQSLGMYDGRAGVWCIRCNNPGSSRPKWTAPRRLTNGIMMNKPTVLASGAWLAPTTLWGYREPFLPELAQERYSNAVCSKDHGETWERIGGADVPDRQFDEHMIVECKDRSLWMLVRTRHGIGQSTSMDGGHTWSPGTPTTLGGPGSRFYIRRLRSRRLLLINHTHFCGRNNLTAMLSEDDGATWRGELLIDGRRDVSYPDSAQAQDGRIFAIYDRERHGAREILLTVFTEEDVLAGRYQSSASRQRMIVDKVVAIEPPVRQSGYVTKQSARPG